MGEYSLGQDHEFPVLPLQPDTELGNWTLLTRSASLPSEENPVPVKKKKMNEHTHRHKHIHTNKCKAHTKTPLGTTKLF